LVSHATPPPLPHRRAGSNHNTQRAPRNQPPHEAPHHPQNAHQHPRPPNPHPIPNKPPAATTAPGTPGTAQRQARARGAATAAPGIEGGKGGRQGSATAHRGRVSSGSGSTRQAPDRKTRLVPHPKAKQNPPAYAHA